MTNPVKLLCLIVGIPIVLVALFVLSGNPYVNGVVYTVQRMNESSALKSVTETIVQASTTNNEDGAILLCAKEISRLPARQRFHFDDTGDFEMVWNFINRDTFRTGMVDKTICLFESIDTSEIDTHMTPVLLRISSSFSRPNQNCVLLSFANARVICLEWTDEEIKSFLENSTPAAAARWIVNWDEKRRETHKTRTLQSIAPKSHTMVRILSTFAGCGSVNGFVTCSLRNSKINADCSRRI